MKRSLLIIVLLALPGLAAASELCSMMGGKCQDACTADQYAESGVFEDCGEKQECCVQKTPSVQQQDARMSGPEGTAAGAERSEDASGR